MSSRSPCPSPDHPSGSATFRIRCTRCRKHVCDICDIGPEQNADHCRACSEVVAHGEKEGPNLAALHAGREPGRCIVCNHELRRGRKALCGDPECLRVYRKATNDDAWLKRKERQRAARQQARQEVG